MVEQISNNQYEDQEISASLRYDEEDVADSDEEQEEEKKEEDPDEVSCPLCGRPQYVILSCVCGVGGGHGG